MTTNIATHSTCLAQRDGPGFYCHYRTARFFSSSSGRNEAIGGTAVSLKVKSASSMSLSNSPGDDLKPGTLTSMIRQSGLPKKLFDGSDDYGIGKCSTTDRRRSDRKLICDKLPLALESRNSQSQGKKQIVTENEPSMIIAGKPPADAVVDPLVALRTKMAANLTELPVPGTFGAIVLLLLLTAQRRTGSHRATSMQKATQ